MKKESKSETKNNGGIGVPLAILAILMGGAPAYRTISSRSNKEPAPIERIIGVTDALSAEEGINDNLSKKGGKLKLIIDALRKNGYSIPKEFNPELYVNIEVSTQRDMPKTLSGLYYTNSPTNPRKICIDYKTACDLSRELDDRDPY